MRGRQESIEVLAATSFVANSPNRVSKPTAASDSEFR